MNDRMRIGIIGCGVIAPTHAESFLRQDNVEIGWACDLLPERAQDLAQRFDIPNVGTDYGDVLADDSIDVISICTDHASHAQIAVAAIEAGKHVICEKALGAKSEHLDAMMAAHADRGDLVFSGIFQHRFNPMHARVKKLLDSGVLGEMLTASMRVYCTRAPEYYLGDPWRGTWAQEGGSLLINQSIHMIDLIAWLLGGVEAVCGSYANRTHGDSIETEDTAAAAVRFKGGVHGVFEATSSSHISWELNLAFHGTEGSLELRDGEIVKLKLADEAREGAVRADLAAPAEPVDTAVGKSYYGAYHISQMADFVQAVREGRQPFITAESARHAVDIVLGVYESSNTGRWITL